MNKRTLKNKVILITGSTRGIGCAIALRCAQQGAKIVVAGKTTVPHQDPHLAGTIYSVAEEIKALGTEALPIALDVRDENQIQQAIQQTIEHFGALDILVNNAGALNLTSTLQTPVKKLDLMYAINVRSAFVCSQLAIPYLSKSPNPHILNISPPIDLNPKWLKAYLAYTIAKYGVSLCTLGMAEELKPQGIAVNSLWPKTTIATAAIALHLPQLYEASRRPEIVADAAHYILTQESKHFTGQFLLDEDVLRRDGVTNFERYAVNPAVSPHLDLYVDADV